MTHLVKSGSLLSGLDHFLVILPSVLVMANVHLAFSENPIIELSTLFFMCGLGEIVFLLSTGGKIPLLMGPSFAHIGFATYYITNISKISSSDEIRSTLLWGYIFSAVIILLLTFLYRLNIVRRIYHFLFPDVVMGPSISLIGLGVASLAVEDTGLNTGNTNDIAISLVTLAAIILLTLTKRKHLRNATIFLGILIGCIYASYKGKFDLWTIPQRAALVCSPHISFSPLLSIPQNWFSIFLLAIPPSIVSFIESLGRITVLDGIYQQIPPTNNNYINNKLFFNALLGHGISHFISASFGSAPCAIYAENIAIMNMNRTNRYQDIMRKYEDVSILAAYDGYSVYPYIFASIVFLATAYLYPLQTFFHMIPKSVIGGMELFIFGLVAAPGIQLLVEKKVDYNKISNQIITASVLIAGISGISIKIATVELNGMGLGLGIGFVLNLVTRFLSALGVLNEQIDIKDVIIICCSKQPNPIKFICKKEQQTMQFGPYTENQLKTAIQQEEIINWLYAAENICLRILCDDEIKEIKIKKNLDQMDITYPMDEVGITQIFNDYRNFCISISNKDITIRISPEMPSRILKHITLKSRERSNEF